MVLSGVSVSPLLIRALVVGFRSPHLSLNHRRLNEGVKLLVPNIGPQCIFQETTAEPTLPLVYVWQ